jgi:hypothetical protein
MLPRSLLTNTWEWQCFKLMCVFITVCFSITPSLRPFVILRGRLASSIRILQSTKMGGFQHGVVSLLAASASRQFISRPSPIEIWGIWGPECPDYIFFRQVPPTIDISGWEEHLKCGTLWYAAIRN